MKLSSKQQKFTFMVGQLIINAYAMGYGLTMGEAHRTQEQQKIYVKQGKSLTMNSKHLDKLAIDLFLFKDGQYLKDADEYKWLGMIWEELGGVWGGRWTTIVDANHFQYNG